MARHIDWRRQFNRLQPYLDGAGGVVNLRYRGASCGVNAFLSVLKSEFENRTSAAKQFGASIRLDRANYKVIYHAGIRSEFARILNKASLSRPMPTPTGVIFNAPAFCNNESGGPQSLEANFNFDRDPNRAEERNDWVSLLIAELREHLQTKRFMIVLLEGSSEDQAEFWSSIWSQANELIQQGLLLVRMVDEEAAHAGRRFDECLHDCEVTLSTQLEGDAVAHAIDDVANLILELTPNLDPAHAVREARGYVLTRMDNVSELHDRLLNFMYKLQEF